MDLIAKFWSRVEKGPSCWAWVGTKTMLGYGQISISLKPRKSIYAHRLSWEIANGRKVPDGLFVRHACDNPNCVNPEHLSVGTQKENMHDCFAKKRHAHGERTVTAKLAREEVEQIRAIQGLPQTQIAAMFGITQQHVSAIRRRIWWKHVS